MKTNIPASPQYETTECPFEQEGYPATYALDALTADERATFLAHLPGCPICTVAVGEMRATVAQLPLLIDEVAPESAPAPALRARLLDAVTADLAAERAVIPSPPTPLTVVPRRRLVETYALAAVLLLALGLGLLGWNLALQREVRQARIERDQAQVALNITRWQLASTTGQPVSGEVVYLRDRQEALVLVSSLPPLPPGQVYQLWLIRDSKPQPSTVFLSASTAVQADLDQYQALAITVEPGPTGSLTPTTTPFVSGALTH